MAYTKVTGTLVDIGDLDLTNVGQIQLDSIAGDADANTSITFSGSDVITIATGGAGRLTIGDGALSPVTNNQIDLGTSSLEFKNAFFDGTVTADAFAGPLTGNVTGNASGTALTVTQAAQTAITSLGTLTTLTVDDITIDGSTISHAGNFTLDVEGDINFDANGSDITLLDGGTEFGRFKQVSNGMRIQTTASDADMTFMGNDNGTEFTAVTIDMSAAGSVGIGTTSPSAPLHVKKDSSETNLIVQSNTGGTGSAIGGRLRLQLGAQSNSGSGNADTQAGDTLGQIMFEGQGTDYSYQGGNIKTIVTTGDGSDNRSNQATAMTFETIAVGSVSPAERIRILSGGGLTFNGDTAVANALDDYEEGTCTMSVTTSGGGASVSLGSATASYTKIGNTVNLAWYSASSTVNAVGSGIMQLNGFPFTSKNVAAHFIGGITHANTGTNAFWATDESAQFFYINPNNTNGYPIKDGTISGVALRAGGSRYIMITCTYQTT